MTERISSRPIRLTKTTLGGLYDISSNNGRCQDLRDGYGLTRDLYRSRMAQGKSSLLARQYLRSV